MDNERTLHSLRAPTNATSHDTGQQNNGTSSLGANPRSTQPRSNGRSLLSLNRQRNSHQANSSRDEGSTTNNVASSRNNTQQLPHIPNIRFRTRHQPSTESAEGVSPLANVRNRGEGIPTFSSHDDVELGSGGVSAAAGSSRRQTRNRLQPTAASGISAAGNSSTAPSRSSPKGRRSSNGTSPRRRYRTNNATSGSNNTTSSSSNTSAPQRSGGLQFQNLPNQPWRPATRFSDDSDEDITLLLMNTPPRLPDLSTDDFVPSLPRDLRSLRGFGDFRGSGTEESPFEILNDSDVSGTRDDTSSSSFLRDEEMARQLQQEEWERSNTPLTIGFRDPSRLQFLQAMHQALGDGPADVMPNIPQRGRRRAHYAPVLRSIPRESNPLQIPTLIEMLPPGLLQAILGDGQFPPDGDDYEALLEMGEQIGAVSRGMSQRDINKIPVKKHRRPPSASGRENAASSSSSPDSASTQCSICLSEFSVGDSKRILPCQHELHKDCVDQWLKTNATCPICRKDIREGRDERL